MIALLFMKNVCARSSPNHSIVEVHNVIYFPLKAQVEIWVQFRTYKSNPFVDNISTDVDLLRIC
jgi:hypothetical protein